MMMAVKVKAFLDRVHARVGDLWWYSAMIFIACRSGDAIQAFIGLWLVPLYVGPQELGAVMPLQSLTSFLTIPIGIIAVVFAKYVNTYITRGEYGKVKSFIRDVFIASFLLFAVCSVGACLIMPAFYSRLRIHSGSLTFLILLCGLVTNVGSIVGGAQQGLKLFKTTSVMHFVSAPIRLVTLLIAMPYRALSGYFLGQTTPAVVTVALSFLDIRKRLRNYAADTSWRRDLPEIMRYLWPYAICTIIGSFESTVISTVYRQRLPEIESSAYYMLSRFAEISLFVGASLNAVLVPLASEAHEKHAEDIRPLKNAVLGSMCFSVILALFFWFTAPFILSLSTAWAVYRPFSRLLPLITICSGLGVSSISIISYEFACRRLGATIVSVITNGLLSVILVCFTGYSYFDGILPPGVVTFMAELNLADLAHVTWCVLAFAVLQFAAVGLIAFRNQRRYGIVHPGKGRVRAY